VLRAENDIQIVVGGHFSVAHIGPEQHEGIKRRIRAAPTAYLDVFEARILPLATHPRLSTWFPMTFLELVDPDEADRLCRISEELVGRYEAVLDARLSDPRDENWRHRMEQRHDMLAQFASRVCGR
jgi:hypothetical protein